MRPLTVLRLESNGQVDFRITEGQRLRKHGISPPRTVYGIWPCDRQWERGDMVGVFDELNVRRKARDVKKEGKIFFGRARFATSDERYPSPWPALAKTGQ